VNKLYRNIDEVLDATPLGDLAGFSDKLGDIADSLGTLQCDEELIHDLLVDAIREVASGLTHYVTRRARRMIAAPNLQSPASPLQPAQEGGGK
jgi:hypothetical protein